MHRIKVGKTYETFRLDIFISLQLTFWLKGCDERHSYFLGASSNLSTGSGQIRHLLTRESQRQKGQLLQGMGSTLIYRRWVLGNWLMISDNNITADWLKYWREVKKEFVHRPCVRSLDRLPGSLLSAIACCSFCLVSAWRTPKLHCWRCWAECNPHTLPWACVMRLKVFSPFIFSSSWVSDFLQEWKYLSAVNCCSTIFF